MMKQFRLATLAAGAALCASHLAIAAAPTSYNAIATARSSATTTLITLTAAGPSTVSSISQAGFGKNLTCNYNQTATTGTPANVVSIQGLVPGANPLTAANWYNVVSTASIVTTTALVVPISAGTAFPNTTNVSIQQVVPATWRVQVVLGPGTTPTTTATVSCTISE